MPRKEAAWLPRETRDRLRKFLATGEGQGKLENVPELVNTCQAPSPFPLPHLTVPGPQNLHVRQQVNLKIES